MVDSLDPQRRSWNMSRIPSRDTKPELTVRSLLHRMGYRFTVDGPRNKKLPGRPDIVLPKYRTVVLVHGCFWHRHKGCPDTTTPKSETAWWRKKLSGNAARDQRNESLLRKAGWNVMIVWECEASKPSLGGRLVRRLRKVIPCTELEAIRRLRLVTETFKSYGKRIRKKNPSSRLR